MTGHDEARHIAHYDQSTASLREIATLVALHREVCTQKPCCLGRDVTDFLTSLDGEDLVELAATALMVVADDAPELARLRRMEERLKALAARNAGLRQRIDAGKQRIAELRGQSPTLDPDAGTPPADPPEGDPDVR